MDKLWNKQERFVNKCVCQNGCVARRIDEENGMSLLILFPAEKSSRESGKCPRRHTEIVFLVNIFAERTNGTRGGRAIRFSLRCRELKDRETINKDNFILNQLKEQTICRLPGSIHGEQFISRSAPSNWLFSILSSSLNSRSIVQNCQVSCYREIINRRSARNNVFISGLYSVCFWSDWSSTNRRLC